MKDAVALADQAKYVITQQALLNTASALRSLDLDDFIESIEKAETVAPFFEPTLYLKNRAAGDPLATMKELATLAKKFAAALPTTCRVCGCTEEKACEDGCSWVAPGLCSACVIAGRHQ